MAVQEPVHRFPTHLERQFELLYERYVTRLAAGTLPRLERQYKKDVRPTTDDIWDEINKLEDGIAGRKDPATRGKLVSYGGTMVPASMRDEIVGVVDKVNEFTILRLATQLRKLGKVGLVQRPQQLIVSLADETPAIRRALESAAELNANLITTTRAEFLDQIGVLTEEAVSKGLSPQALAKQYQHLTGVTKSRAKFWARDQVGKMLGNFNQIRQQEAGFPGYIWVTSRDARVRPDHAWRHGRYFEWNAPGIKPGEDFNCRCEAQAAFGREQQLSRQQWERDINVMNRDRRKIAKRRKVEPVLLDVQQLQELARAGA